MQRKIRWGLLGAGNILHRWMKGVRQVEDMEIAAVSSRTKERAQLMAETFQIPEALTYEELLAREDIDIVYIPVPHPAHKDLAIRAMNAGKAVLVEKPAGINARELDEMVACARKNGVFFMEAVWTRFFPLIEQLRPYFSEDGSARYVRSAPTFLTGRKIRLHGFLIWSVQAAVFLTPAFITCILII